MRVVAPTALLSYLCVVAPSFSHYLESLVSSRCCATAAPLNIIVYVDEAVPGDLLALDNTRKCWCFYWQFEESDQHVLSREDSWFLGGVLRNGVCKELRRGISYAFKRWIQGFFARPSNFHIGVTVHCASGGGTEEGQRCMSSGKRTLETRSCTQ